MRPKTKIFIVVFVVGGVLAVVVPNFIRARNASAHNSTVDSMRLPQASAASDSLASNSKKTTNTDLGNPDDGKWVSIGLLDTDDPKRRVDFFLSMVTDIQVAGYPEGWASCQVMVRTDDVECVHAFLITNSFKETAFHSIWTNH